MPPGAEQNSGAGDGCFVSHLECSRTGERHPAGVVHGVSLAGAPLLVRYDLDGVAAHLDREALAHRPSDMWRYRELLPYADPLDVVSLGETMTPLVSLGPAVLVKDEGRLPTGSFKARGLALAVTMAKAFGISRIAMPTAGNAGAALAAYAARAGIEAFVFTPDDTPEITAAEIAYHGAQAFRVDGLIDVCGRVVAAGHESAGWFDFSTLREPYRIEGKKTMGLELAEQLGWRLPEAIFYPTGGGTGLIGMWKGFQELRQIGWIEGPLPKMIAVQTVGCAPIKAALEAGDAEVVEPWANVDTEVHGVRVPKPFGGRLILSVIRESYGFAAAVEDAEVAAVRAEVACTEGLNLCPEGAACLVAYREAVTAGRLGGEACVVLFNSASGLKSPMPPLTSCLAESKFKDLIQFG